MGLRAGLFAALTDSRDVATALSAGHPRCAHARAARLSARRRRGWEGRVEGVPAAFRLGLVVGGLARAKAPRPRRSTSVRGQASADGSSSGPPTRRSSAASAPVPTRPSRRCSRAASPRSPRPQAFAALSGASEQRSSSRSGSTRIKPSSTTSARHYRGTPRRPPRPVLPSSSSSPTWSSEGYEGCSSRFSRRSGVTSADRVLCLETNTSSYVTAPDPRSARRSSSTTRTSTSLPHCSCQSSTDVKELKTSVIKVDDWVKKASEALAFDGNSVTSVHCLPWSVIERVKYPPADDRGTTRRGETLPDPAAAAGGSGKTRRAQTLSVPAKIGQKAGSSSIDACVARFLALGFDEFVRCGQHGRTVTQLCEADPSQMSTSEAYLVSLADSIGTGAVLDEFLTSLPPATRAVVARRVGGRETRAHPVGAGAATARRSRVNFSRTSGSPRRPCGSRRDPTRF